MNSSIKESLLVSHKAGKFALYDNEAQDKTPTEKMAINATFKQNSIIVEHFAGVSLIRKLVGSHLTAKNILVALENCIQPFNVSLPNN